LSIGWHLLELPALSVCAAALEADGVYVGQWMVSRPIVLGPLLGAALGAPFAGVGFGAVFEAFSLETAPVGGHIPINGAVGTACAVLMCAGPAGVAPAAALPAGLALGWAAARMEHIFRDRRAALAAEAQALAGAGEEMPWSSFACRSVGGHVAAMAAFIYVSSAAGGPAARAIWGALPGPLRLGFSAAFNWAPWLAAAILIRALVKAH